MSSVELSQEEVINRGLERISSKPDEPAPKQWKVKPLEDRILVKEIPAPEKSHGGIFIPDAIREERGLIEAEVIAVGEGKYAHGIWVPTSVKVGDRVIVEKHQCIIWPLAGVPHLMCRQVSIWCVMEAADVA